MLKLSLGRLPKICRQRLYSSTISSQDLNIDALNTWIARPKQLSVIDTFRPEHLSDLYITLPTRDGTKQAYTPPEEFNELGYGHHLAFFHLRNPESLLRPDGTDANFCPPAPFTRRMWGGGKIHWVPDNPLLISSEATAKSTIVSVHKKGFEKGTPIVIVNQNIEICRGWDNVTHAVVEERSHIYLPQTAQVNRRVREGAPLIFYSIWHVAFC
jgi:hydroxyacyl-ACP dehydratase HTD2-like protein with hotdog domain